MRSDTQYFWLNIKNKQSRVNMAVQGIILIFFLCASQAQATSGTSVNYMIGSLKDYGLLSRSLRPPAFLDRQVFTPLSEPLGVIYDQHSVASQDPLFQVELMSDSLRQADTMLQAVESSRPVVLWLELGAPFNFPSTFAELDRVFPLTIRNRTVSWEFALTAKQQNGDDLVKAIAWLKDKYSEYLQRTQSVTDEIFSGKVSVTPYYKAAVDWVLQQRGKRNVAVRVEETSFDGWLFYMLMNKVMDKILFSRVAGDVNGMVKIYKEYLSDESSYCLRRDSEYFEMIRKAILDNGGVAMNIVIRGKLHRKWLGPLPSQHGIKCRESFDESNLDELDPLNLYSYMQDTLNESQKRELIIKGLICYELTEHLKRLAKAEIDDPRILGLIRKTVNNLSAEQVSDWERRIGKTSIAVVGRKPQMNDRFRKTWEWYQDRTQPVTIDAIRRIGAERKSALQGASQV
ncbi:MAG: hypothetical protein WCG78_07955 [Candidatus Omnitrophota bacterium]